jgi:predicted MFS family arabinose efflux permease
MGIVPHEYATLLVTFIVVNVFLMIFSTVLGGYMVTESRVFNATGRLGSFRNNAMTLAGLIAGPAAGFLASKVFGLTAFANALMLFGLFVFIFFALREKPVARDPNAPSPLQKLREEIKPLLQAKTFWAAVGMTFFITVMPGFGTLLTYYQTNDLHFSDQFIGNLGLVGGITGLIGGFGYILLCRIFRLRTMLAISIVTGAAATALFEYYRSPGTAIIITAVSGLLGALASIATFDLAARASPVRSASMCYSLLMAVYNLGSQLGDVGGSWIHDRFHVSFFNLIWISAGTTLLTLIAVPLLPSSLVDSTDGEPDPADPTLERDR